MKWKEAKLQDLAFFQRGFDLLKRNLKDGEYPVISSSGLQGYHAVKKADAPGVIIGRKGTLGTVHYVDSDYWPHDTTLWVKDFKDNYPRYVYYFLQTLDLARFDSGGANPTLNRNHIHKLDILKPPTPHPKTNRGYPLKIRRPHRQQQPPNCIIRGVCTPAVSGVVRAAAVSGSRVRPRRRWCPARVGTQKAKRLGNFKLWKNAN